MRRFFIFILVIIVVLVLFIANIFITTGFFREIENTFDGETVKTISLYGTEDITVSFSDSFAIISSTDRRGYQSEQDKRDGLYYLDLKSGKHEVTPLTDFFKQPFSPHGISMIKHHNSYLILAINHTESGHSFEMFELKGKAMTHLRTYQNPLMISPNDVVLIDENHFYFTNDHHYTKGLGLLLEDYAGLAISTVVYYDGNKYNEVADGIAYANGLNYDSDRKLLFVASPRNFIVKVYSRNDDGSLNFIEDIPCNTGPDNIEFDEIGNLWIGAHPNLLRFAAYAKGKEETSPSEIIKIDYRGLDDYSVETIYLDNGETMSASSVAAPFGDNIITGNVMDEAFLILKRGN